MISAMIRTQVQIPEPLYREMRRVAAARDWSVSEVVRRAVEQYVAPEHWRDLLSNDEARA